MTSLIRYTRKPPLGKRINWNHPLAPIRDGVKGLCFLVNEGGGNKLHNLTKNGDLTFGNDPAWKAGQVRLDGGNDYLQNQNGITGIGSEGTFTMRFLARNLGGAVGYFEISDSTTNERFVLYDTPNLYIYDPDGSNYWGLEPSPLTNNVWYTLSLTYKFGAESDIYVNGSVLVPGTSDNSTAQVGLDSLMIGAYGAGTPTNFLETDLDFFYYHPWVLSSSEVAKLHPNPYCFIEPLLPIELMAYAAAVGGIVPFRRRIEGY